MVRTLVKREMVAVDGRALRVTYFEHRTGRGHRRFSAELVLAPGDRIILDDDSMVKLETRTARLAPATLYSRMLAKAHAA